MKDPQLFSGKELRFLEMEKDFQNRLTEAARLMGWRIYSVPDSRRASLSGFPDLVMWEVKSHRLIMAELKREKGRLSEAQKVVLEELDQIPGIEVYVWRPSDWDEILKILRKTF